MRKIKVLVGVLILLFTLFGCTKGNGAGLKADSDFATLSGQAENLLSKYDLQTKGVAKKQTFKLEGNFELLNEASQKIGFDLSRYKANEVEALVYILKEISQDNGGQVKAYVLLDRAIIGTYVILDGYVSELTTFAINSFRSSSIALSLALRSLSWLLSENTFGALIKNSFFQFRN